MGLENIYLEGQSARGFGRAIRYDAAALKSLAQSLAGHLAAGAAQPLHVLDIGTGPGFFILPVAESFEENRPPDYRLDCLDVSEHMSRLFAAELARAAVPREKVRYLMHDAERGLGAYRVPEKYDLVFATFVLHYVGDWRRLLDEVVACMRPGGLLVQAEVVGDFRNIDGQFDTESPILFRQFWRRYFTERARHSAWQSAVSVSDLSPVFTYLRRVKRFRLFRENTFLWGTAVTWRDFCEWIAAAPLSSLGAGLHPEARARLSEVMRRWLKERELSETEEVKLRWGIKTSVLSKGTS